MATEWCKVSCGGLWPVSPLNMSYSPITNISYDYGPDQLGTLSIDVRCEPKDIEKFRKLFDEQFLGKNSNNEKENKKMEARKCDRCGKLYEIVNSREDRIIDTRFKFIQVPNAEDMIGNKIIELQTRPVRIYISQYDECADLCPECRKSFKKWFESTDKEAKNG